MVLRPVPAAQDSDQPLQLICLPGDPLLVPYMFLRPVPAAWVLRISHTVELLLMILPLLVPYMFARLVPAAQLLRNTVEPLLMILPILVPYNVLQSVPAAWVLRISHTVELQMILPILRITVNH